MDFDHHSAHFAASWREVYAGLRASCPVPRTETRGGFTVLTRYDDVKRALLAPVAFVAGVTSSSPVSPWRAGSLSRPTRSGWA